MNNFKPIFFCFFFCGCFISMNGQTFFETAKDDGIISFTDIRASQIKLNLSSTAISYGYNYVKGTIADKKRFLFSTAIKAKPNDDGVAALVKTGNLQPGLKVNAAAGWRFVTKINRATSIWDFTIKPTWQLNGYSIYDTTRIANGGNPFYKTTKSSAGINLLINGLLTPGKNNIYFGIQYGPQWGNNSDDLDKATIQKVIPYYNSQSQTLNTDIKEVKYGKFKNVTQYPFKVDLIVDPGIHINHSDKTNTMLGFFGYFRTDQTDKKHREGFGMCFLDAQHPSRIFSSLGYELTGGGGGIKPASQQSDKGIVFFSVGYSIF